MTRSDEDDPRRDARRSGVYRARDARSVTSAPGGGLELVPVSLVGVADKTALLERVAAALAFPDWFGANWDALEDCLGDLSWRQAAGWLLRIEGFEALQTAARDDFGVLVDLLSDVADDWRQRGRPFIAVFVDPQDRLALRVWDGG